MLAVSGLESRRPKQGQLVNSITYFLVNIKTDDKGYLKLDRI